MAGMHRGHDFARYFRAGCLLAAGFGLAGCGTPRDDVEILVSTSPPQASCTLTRAGAPIATVPSTPGIAVVVPTKDDITIGCIRSGYEPATYLDQATGNVQTPGVTVSERTGAGYQGYVAMTLVPRGSPLPLTR
jgi:hypothetical protein